MTLSSSFRRSVFALLVLLAGIAALPGCSGDSSPKTSRYSTCKPYTRWWWFSSDIDKKDVRDQLVWLRDHEFGHSIQNCRFGPLMPFLVSIPSSTRYRWRLFRERVLKKPSATPYDSVWFEAQATRLGTEFMTRFREKEME